MNNTIVLYAKYNENDRRQSQGQDGPYRVL